MAPRRNVGNAKAASTALGKARKIYSGSKAWGMVRTSTSPKKASTAARPICGADHQLRQFHRASNAKGQVGHKNQSRSRRSEEHTSELQSRGHLVCRLLLEKKKTT